MYNALLENLKNLDPLAEIKPERGKQTQQRLIAAAVPIFAYKGFQQATTHEIAAAAGVNQGLITYHFGNKLNLWKHVIDEQLGSFRDHLTHHLLRFGEGDEKQFFELGVKTFVRWAARSPDTTRLLLDANKVGDEISKWCAERHMKPLYALFSELIRKGQEAGFVREAPIVHLYYQIVSTAMVFTIPDEVRVLSRKNVATKRFIEAQADLLYSMLLRP
jgi:AcrR family transcriptional regulator